MAWDRCAISPATAVAAVSMATGLLTEGAVEMMEADVCVGLRREAMVGMATTEGVIEMGANGSVCLRREMKWDRCVMFPATTVAVVNMTTTE